MVKTQSNLIRLASRGLDISKVDYNTVVHTKRAEDINFKSSLFESINLMIDEGIDSKIDIHTRFALANLYHWLRKHKSVSSGHAESIIKQILPICVELHHQDHENIAEFVRMFQPVYEDESFSITVFPKLKECLSVYDLVDIIRGLDSYFNLIIQRHFDDKSHYTLLELSHFIQAFNAKIDEELEAKSEMSFMMDSSAIQLSFGEIYHAFLNVMIPVFFHDNPLTDQMLNTLYLRLIKETPIHYVGELLEDLYHELKRSPVLRQIKEYNQLIEHGTEDEIDDYTEKLKLYVIAIVNRLDLSIQMKLYDGHHNLFAHRSVKRIIEEQLENYTKEPHFTIYAINRLLEFKRKYLFSKPELIIYIREMSETVALLRSQRFLVPDEEMRFFIDRMLKNMASWATFAELCRKLRNNLVTTERNQSLHALLQECSMNNRHASALISFYYAAKIETQYSNKISLINIEEIANRLGATFSITRRFKVAKFIENCLDEGKLKEQPLEMLQKGGYFSLVAKKVINQKELEYAFDQYIEVQNFFEDYNDMVSRTEYIKRLVTEMERYINSLVRTEFYEVIQSLESNKDIHEVLQFAETKVITLLTRELDSFRRDNTLSELTRETIEAFIKQYVEDSHAQYQAEKETQNINIADLYMQIQSHSMKVTVVLGDVRQHYNKTLEAIRTQDNFDDIERIQLILGGLAVAKRDEELNFEKRGLLTILSDMKETPGFYSSLILSILSDPTVNIELKDEMGKTRHVHHEHFAKTLTILKSVDETQLCRMFHHVILMDLLKEVADALVSARNMAKNIQELKITLDDIFTRSADLLEFAGTEYNKIMGILTP